jgi:hypothetical protein
MGERAKIAALTVIPLMRKMTRTAKEILGNKLLPPGRRQAKDAVSTMGHQMESISLPCSQSLPFSSLSHSLTDPSSFLPVILLQLILFVAGEHRFTR